MFRVPSKKGRRVYSVYTNPKIFNAFREACDKHQINYADCIEATLIELTNGINSEIIKANQNIEIRSNK